MKATVQVLLYYKYVPISDHETFAAEHLEFCRGLNLKGRVLIAKEGINGTLAGSVEATEKYLRWAAEHPLFSDMPFKIDQADAVPFKRLSVKPRREIVTLGLDEDVDPKKETGEYLTPEEWKRAIEEEDVVVFDVRNDYESAVGRFENAIAPPIQYFRELPEVLKNYRHLKEKKVLMYCTGGIRCEKASALFRREGFRQVYQLEGGILTYGKEFGSEHWEGECFVFDERMTVPVGDEAPPVAVCAHTGRKGADFINCKDDDCHRLFLINERSLAENPDFHYCPDCFAKLEKGKIENSGF